MTAKLTATAVTVGPRVSTSMVNRRAYSMASRVRHNRPRNKMGRLVERKTGPAIYEGLSVGSEDAFSAIRVDKGSPSDFFNRRE